MPRMPWSRFNDDYPQAHLVVAAIPFAEAVGPDLKEVHDLLLRLIRKQAPTGNYTATIVRGGATPEVHLAFEQDADARKLANAMRAKVIGGFDGGATRRAFRLTAPDAAAIMAELSQARIGPQSE